MPDFAPGIPSDRKTHALPETEDTWQLSVQEHSADKAGVHWDLRLTDPKTGHSHSWAIPKMSYPEQGKIRLAVQQPTHTSGYATWEGNIPHGYGKGDVKLIENAQVRVKSSADRVEFHHPTLGKMVLRKKDTANWLMIKPKMEKTAAEIPDTKPKYKVDKWDNINPNDKDIWQAKLDGGFVYYTLGPEGIKAFSYRRSKRSGESIEHTTKLEGLDTAKVPEELHGAILMGEAYHPNLTLGQVGGVLNSRNKPIPMKLKPAIHGILKLPDRDVSNMSNWEKLKFLQETAKKIPVFDLPDTAETPEAKHRLWTKIERQLHGQTAEGLMVYPEFGSVRKAPITPTDDFPITGTTPGTGKYKDVGVGALLVGSNQIRVGTGLSDPLRRVLHENPELIKGLVARVAAKEQLRSGKLRTASFKGFHPEKSEPEAYERLVSLLGPSIKTASNLPAFVSKIPNASDALIHLSAKLPMVTQEKILEAMPLAFERWSVIDPGFLTFTKALLVEALLDPALDVIAKSKAYLSLRQSTPNGRLALGLEQLSKDLPHMGFDKLSELVQTLRSLDKQAEAEETSLGSLGNVAGGALVGAGAGALAGKGVKEKMWGALIGAGVGGFAGRGARRLEPTIRPANPLPSYMQGQGLNGTGNR